MDEDQVNREQGTDQVAPAVVAVMVTHNPGPWLEDALAALGAQDYPDFAVLIIDAASTEDPLARVVEVLPHAYVRRLGHNPGYAAATNRAMRVVQGASHFVLCHDDVAPEPDAVRRMLEEAYRHNAGVVMPKQLDWVRPELIRSMGGTVDRTAAPIPLVEPGEYDQGQHDVSQDIFVASGGFLLVRADLFDALDGFDAGISLFGEDVDFSWRAQIAGARIVTAPSARVRHLEAAVRGLRETTIAGSDNSEAISRQAPSYDELLLRRRHRLRTALKVRSGPKALSTALFLSASTLVELVLSMVTGRTGRAAAVAAAWVWNLTHLRGLLRARRALRRTRSVEDGILRRRLGSARQRFYGVARREWEIRAARLHREGLSGRDGPRGRDGAVSVRNLTLAVTATIAVVWTVGSRDLPGDDLAVVGQFVPLPDSPLDSIERYFGLVPDQAFGDAVLASPAHLVTALVSTVTLADPRFALYVASFGSVALGLWGALRLARPLGSTRARLATVAAYAAVPIPYDAFATGRLDMLIGYGAAPWILHRLLRTHASTPYLSRRSSDRVRLRSKTSEQTEELETIDFSSAESIARNLDANQMLDHLMSRRQVPVEGGSVVSETGRNLVAFAVLRRMIPLTLLLALVGSFLPATAAAVVATGISLVIGSLLAGAPGKERAERVLLLVTVGVAAVLSLLLLLPSLWSSGTLAGTATAHRPSSFVDLLGFDITAGDTGSVLVLGLLVAGAPGLLFARQWRLVLSCQLWSVVVGNVVLAWLLSRGVVATTLLEPDAFLSLAAVAAGLNVGVSVLAITFDLRGYTFGWRQLMPFVAVVGVIAAFVPVTNKAGNGSWNLPALSTPELLSSIDGGSSRQEGSFRWMWVGDPSILPGTPRVVGDVGVEVVTDRVVPWGPGTTSDAGAAEAEVERRLASALDGETVHLGRLLAPYNVRYVAVPTSTGASSGRGVEAAAPAGVTEGLGAQIDLRRFQIERSVTVFENTEWIPVRAVLTPEATLAARQPARTDAATDLSGAVPVLDPVDERTWSGEVPAGEVFAGHRPSRSWRLEVDGRPAARQDAFGWASTYSTGDGGTARLEYRPPTRIVLAQAAIVLMWSVLAGLAFRYRARRGRFV